MQQTIIYIMHVHPILLIFFLHKILHVVYELFCHNLDFSLWINLLWICWGNISQVYVQEHFKYFFFNFDKKLWFFKINCDIVQFACFESFPFRQKFYFSSARPLDFDGMLGTGLPVTMYTTKTPINMWRFKVPQLKEFLIFSVKDRYQLNYLFVSKTSIHRQFIL